MIDLDRIDDAIDLLEAIRAAIVAMRPTKQQAPRLNRIYNAIVNAQRELQDLAGQSSDTEPDQA